MKTLICPIAVTQGQGKRKDRNEKGESEEVAGHK